MDISSVRGDDQLNMAEMLTDKKRFNDLEKVMNKFCVYKQKKISLLLKMKGFEKKIIWRTKKGLKRFNF